MPLTGQFCSFFVRSYPSLTPFRLSNEMTKTDSAVIKAAWIDLACPHRLFDILLQRRTERAKAGQRGKKTGHEGEVKVV